MADPIEAVPKRRHAIPILHTRGSHYQTGYDIGHTFGALIRSLLGSLKLFLEEQLPAYGTPRGRANYDAALAVARRRCPDYVAELAGTAAGAQVPFHHLMLLNLDRLVPPRPAPGEQPTPAPGEQSPPAAALRPQYGCSTVCCNHPGQVLLGHTEDALDEVQNHLYLVNVTITDGDTEDVEEQFTALCYAGYLPGFCMGYNHHGFVYSVNVLFPSLVQPGKSAPYFLARALLSARTFEEAQTILRDRGVGAGDGFSVNMSFAQQEGSPVFHNVEVGVAVDVDETPLSVLTVCTGEHHLHTNKYLRLALAEDTQYEGSSSDARHERAELSAAPCSRPALLNLLGGAEGPWPFFREEQSDGVTTVTTGLFDLTQKTWTIWMGNPRHTPPLLTLPLRYKWNE